MKNVHANCLLDLGCRLEIFEAYATALLVVIILGDSEWFRRQLYLKLLDDLPLQFLYSLLPPLLAAFLADGSGTHTYQAFKLEYYDANAAHQGEEDGAENRKDQDEWVVRLEMPIALTDIVESFLKVA